LLRWWETGKSLREVEFFSFQFGPPLARERDVNAFFSSLSISPPLISSYLLQRLDLERAVTVIDHLPDDLLVFVRGEGRGAGKKRRRE